MARSQQHNVNEEAKQAQSHLSHFKLLSSECASECTLNKRMKKPMDMRIIKPMDKRLNKPVKEPMNERVNKLTNKPIQESINEKMNELWSNDGLYSQDADTGCSGTSVFSQQHHPMVDLSASYYAVFKILIIFFLRTLYSTLLTFEMVGAIFSVFHLDDVVSGFVAFHFFVVRRLEVHEAEFSAKD